MWRSSNAQWWLLLTIALSIVVVWPPRGDRSLAIKAVNWIADPSGRLPVRPPPLPIRDGDAPGLVAEHDLQLWEYDALHAKGGWTRLRLRLKVARDPTDASTERQVLVAIAVVVAFLALRLEGKEG